MILTIDWTSFAICASIAARVLIELCCAYKIPEPIAMIFFIALIVSAPFTSVISTHLKNFVLKSAPTFFANSILSDTVLTTVMFLLKTFSF